MNKYDQEILVIARNKLFDGDEFQGVVSEGKFEERILKHAIYMRRGDAEENEAFKQPISYGLVVNPDLKQVFVYQRANKEAHADIRLIGKWSIGVGGHIEKVDTQENVLQDSMRREISEEFLLNAEITNIVPLGYINDDSNSVGKVHFGVLYAIETTATSAVPTSEEIQVGGLVDISVAQQILRSIPAETWTTIAAPLLDKYV